MKTLSNEELAYVSGSGWISWTLRRAAEIAIASGYRYVTSTPGETGCVDANGNATGQSCSAE
jgi:ribosomal protein S8E